MMSKVFHSFTGYLLKRFLGKCEFGNITFIFPDKVKYDFFGNQEGPTAEIELRSFKTVRLLFQGGYLGLAEGYILGDWTTPSLPDLFAFGIANQEILDKSLSGTTIVTSINKLNHFVRRNSRPGSRRNIAEHYDLGNEFFSKWLDSSLTYSSALFDGPKWQDLYEAQEKKYARIVKNLKIKNDDRVLEIGCGWGGFAEFVALETGAEVTAITISGEQHDYASERIERVGLSDQVKILIRDYRDIEEKFDAIVSIEMLEAVGEAYWSDYFSALNNALARGGQAIIQVITIPDELFNEYRRTIDFIQTYIFPGGMLIPPSKIREFGKKENLAIVDEHMFGLSYSKTLEIWRKNFLDRWHEIEPLGFDSQFKRMWEYYLSYTSAGFKAGILNVGQFHLVKN
ncbi:MAG: cyclopropane-fatty-acyl-phospholipid synthase family protein [Pseudomonadota bacterium]|nr:cyclopropane-fatty-acyl-phospholipid synthase family protein [Pseudomonadota bacterium]